MKYFALKPSYLVSLLAVAVCALLLSAPSLADGNANLTLKTIGGEVWSWQRQIRGECTCEKCAQIEVTVNQDKTPATRFGQRFAATINLMEGENRVIVSCRHADGTSCATEELTFIERLRDVPTAWLKIAVSPENGSIILSGKDSAPSEATGSPIVRYVWTEDSSNPASIGEGGFIALGDKERLLAKPPTVDGEYYFFLTVTDTRGKTDRARAYFVVENGRPRQVNTDTENAAWIDRGVIYGTLPHLFGESPFLGVAQKLDYLKELGVAAVWLAPSTQTVSRSGYRVTNYFELREDYGTKAKFRHMVQEAHKRGIRVMMDFVPNHCSVSHRYMRHAIAYGEASPYFHFCDRFAGTGPHTFYFGWEVMPNLNYENPEVRRWMIEAFAYWVREFGVDGFRIDAVWGVRQRTPEFGLQLRRELARIKPDIFLLAEAGARDAYYFENGYDAAYDWTDNLGNWSWHNIFDEEAGIVDKLTRALTNEGRGYHPDALVFHFLNNNDTGAQFISRHGEELTRPAAAMLLSLPGVPCVYTGEEIGAEFHPYRTRTPISWEDHWGLRDYYHKLIALRRDIPALHSRRWELLQVDSAQEVLSYLRYGKDKEIPVWVAINFSGAPAVAHISPSIDGSFVTWGDFEDLLGGAQEKIAQGRPGVGEVLLPPFSVKFLVPAKR